MNRLVIAVVLLALAGCNTVEGLGRDLQNIGGAITGTAAGVQNASSSPTQVPPPPDPIVPADNCQPDADGLVLDGCPKQP